MNGGKKHGESFFLPPSLRFSCVCLLFSPSLWPKNSPRSLASLSQILLLDGGCCCCFGGLQNRGAAHTRSFTRKKRGDLDVVVWWWKGKKRHLKKRGSEKLSGRSSQKRGSGSAGRGERREEIEKQDKDGRRPTRKRKENSDGKKQKGKKKRASNHRTGNEPPTSSLPPRASAVCNSRRLKRERKRGKESSPARLFCIRTLSTPPLPFRRQSLPSFQKRPCPVLIMSRLGTSSLFLMPLQQLTARQRQNSFSTVLSLSLNSKAPSFLSSLPHLTPLAPFQESRRAKR